MTCNCQKTKEQDDTDKCPEGQHKVDGQCVDKTEQIGDAPPAPAEPQTADVGDTQKTDPVDCGEGFHYDSATEQCMPNEEGHVDGVPPAAESAPKWFSQYVDKTEQHFAKLEQQLGTHAVSKPKPKPTALVSNPNAEAFSLEKAVKKMTEWFMGDKETGCTINIPLEFIRDAAVTKVKTPYGTQEAYRGNLSESYKLSEAVTVSGTHATQDLDTDVAIVPGGISFKPVFQFAKVREPAKGMDRARFFKSTLPGTLSQTVGTTATEASLTATSVEITPSTITGVYLKGDYDEIENSPFDLVDLIIKASAAAYEDFVATDMLDTVSAEGTLTPGLWIKASDGATVTTSDAASVAFDETGVAVGREFLEDQGYLRGGVKPILFLDSQQWRELVTSSNVTSLATNSLPDIWVNAQLENFMGCQLVVTNAIQENTAQTNKGLNAIMCIPKHSYGIAVKRAVTVKLHDIPEDNQVRINTSWRTKTGVIDATSIVRISSTGA